MKAISAGLFPYFLKQNDNNAEKEFATLRAFKEPVVWKVNEVGKPGPERETAGFHCALNGLHLKGYTHHECQLKTVKDTYTFSRRKHATMSSSGVTDIFIPNNDENEIGQERNGLVKQFAIDYVKEDDNETDHLIFAPAEFHEDESIRSHPMNCATIRDPGPRLEDNGFVTREIAYEDIFRDHFKADLANGSDMKFSIFSRVIVNERGDESW